MFDPARNIIKQVLLILLCFIFEISIFELYIRDEVLFKITNIRTNLERCFKWHIEINEQWGNNWANIESPT